jgi:cytochrome c5
MTGIITPATNVIWGRSFADDLSEEDWQLFLQSAIQISLSASAMSLVPPDAAAAEDAAANDWQEWSAQLAALADAAKLAAETRDQAALLDAGDAMVEVCEACHAVFLTGAQ